MMLLSASMALTGCAGTVASLPPARCASLVPADWADGVPGAAIPAADGADDWRKAFVAQAGQLSKANGRTKAAISIFGDCEAKANAARPK